VRQSAHPDRERPNTRKSIDSIQSPISSPPVSSPVEVQQEKILSRPVPKIKPTTNINPSLHAENVRPSGINAKSALPFEGGLQSGNKKVVPSGKFVEHKLNTQPSQVSSGQNRRQQGRYRPAVTGRSPSRSIEAHKEGTQKPKQKEQRKTTSLPSNNGNSFKKQSTRGKNNSNRSTGDERSQSNKNTHGTPANNRQKQNNLKSKLVTGIRNKNHLTVDVEQTSKLSPITVQSPATSEFTALNTKKNQVKGKITKNTNNVSLNRTHNKSAAVSVLTNKSTGRQKNEDRSKPSDVLSTRETAQKPTTSTPRSHSSRRQRERPSSRQKNVLKNDETKLVNRAPEKSEKGHESSGKSKKKVMKVTKLTHKNPVPTEAYYKELQGKKIIPGFAGVVMRRDGKRILVGDGTRQNPKGIGKSRATSTNVSPDKNSGANQAEANKNKDTAKGTNTVRTEKSYLPEDGSVGSKRNQQQQNRRRNQNRSRNQNTNRNKNKVAAIDIKQPRKLSTSENLSASAGIKSRNDSKSKQNQNIQEDSQTHTSQTASKATKSHLSPVHSSRHSTSRNRGNQNRARTRSRTVTTQKLNSVPKRPKTQKSNVKQTSKVNRLSQDRAAAKRKNRNKSHKKIVAQKNNDISFEDLDAATASLLTGLVPVRVTRNIENILKNSLPHHRTTVESNLLETSHKNRRRKNKSRTGPSRMRVIKKLAGKTKDAKADKPDKMAKFLLDSEVVYLKDSVGIPSGGRAPYKRLASITPIKGLEKVIRHRRKLERPGVSGRHANVVSVSRTKIGEARDAGPALKGKSLQNVSKKVKVFRRKIKSDNPHKINYDFEDTEKDQIRKEIVDLMPKSKQDKIEVKLKLPKNVKRKKLVRKIKLHSDDPRAAKMYRKYKINDTDDLKVAQVLEETKRAGVASDSTATSNPHVTTERENSHNIYVQKDHINHSGNPSEADVTLNVETSTELEKILPKAPLASTETDPSLIFPPSPPSSPASRGLRVVGTSVRKTVTSTSAAKPAQKTDISTSAAKPAQKTDTSTSSAKPAQETVVSMSSAKLAQQTDTSTSSAQAAPKKKVEINFAEIFKPLSLSELSNLDFGEDNLVGRASQRIRTAVFRRRIVPSN